MLKGKNNSVIDISSTIKDMIIEITSKQTGAVSVVDNHNKLIGLITDYDIRQVLKSGKEFMSTDINELMNKDIYNVGISVIDLSTGRNYLHSILSKIEDDNYWSDEIGRFIHFYNPSEILFQLKNCDYDQNQIIQYWDIYHNSIQINHYNDTNYTKIDYQNEGYS